MPTLPSPEIQTPTAQSETLLRVSPSSLQREAGYLVPNPGMDEGTLDGGIGMEYLTKILMSSVYDVAIESELQLATKLSNRLGNNVWLKREDLQPVSL